MGRRTAPGTVRSRPAEPGDEVEVTRPTLRGYRTATRYAHPDLEAPIIPSQAPTGPPPTSAVVALSAAVDRVADRLTHRPLVVVTAAAGWGKTTVLAEQLRPRAPRWWTAGPEIRTARRLATALLIACGAPADLPTDPTGHDGSPETDDPVTLADHVAGALGGADEPPLVIDDAHALRDTPAAELLRRLADRSGGSRQLVVLARTDLGLVDDRRRAQGDVLEIDASHLALDLDATATLVERELRPDRALAARITDAVGGWPAATRLLLDALPGVAPGARAAAVDALAGSSGPVASYLDTEVLPDTADDTRRLLARVAMVGDVTAPDLAALTGERPAALARELHGLVARGLARRRPDRPDRVDLAPVVGRYVRDCLLPELDPDGHLIDEVVEGLVRRGELRAPVEILTSAGRHADVARVLRDHGRDLILAGALATVADAAARVPDGHRDREIEILHAEALAFRGEWAPALRCLEAAGVGDTGALSARLATCAGLIHHVRGDLTTAIEAYARGPEHDESDPDHAALATWRATAHWLRGELPQARSCAASAMATAARHGDDRALAFAHTATALVAASDGDRRGNESHYRRALDAARRAGDRLQEARIRTNLGSHHLEESRYADALEETNVAIDLAESQGFGVIMGVARCNRAEILVRTGALDEAIADAERAREVFASMGSRTEAYAHHLLGAARTDRGELVLARQAYDRSLRLAGPAGDRQAVVPAQLGIARAELASDPDAAQAAIDRARELDDGMHLADVEVTDAWVAIARGDRARARELASTAITQARDRANAAVVAEATTCLAVADDDPRPRLEEAAALWRDLDAPLWSARVELGLARRTSDPAHAAEGAWLERRLATLGCPSDRGPLFHRMVVGSDASTRPRVRALGGFVVERDGRPIPPSEWGSRKARELLKVLVTRGGRSASREELGHLLWPDEPYAKVSNRLSVALSIVRSVLAGDGADDARGAIVTNAGTVRLDVEVVEVDLDAFQRLADDGLRAAREGRREDAIALLVRAEELYGGDLLEDDLDADWVIERRTALRSLYLAVARTLARQVAHEDPDLTIRLLLRVLDRDGFDEPAHLNLCVALMRAGRHGEARRRYRLYEDRMTELDLPAVPFHQVAREVTQGRPDATVDQVASG